MAVYETAHGIHDIGVYRRPNGSLVYLDFQYPLNGLCNASIAADSAIAGPGTMLIFVVPAALTVAVAVVIAVVVLVGEYGAGAGDGAGDGAGAAGQSTAAASSSDNVLQPDSVVRRVWRHRKALLENCDVLLMSLCDLQVLTGGSIVIAAFMQGPELSFYHEVIIVRYWRLIMASFWCVPRRCTAEDDGLMGKFRRLLLAAAVSAALVFAMRELVRQPRDWDCLDGRRCYLYDGALGYDDDGDGGQNVGQWSTLVGMMLYLLGASASLFSRSDQWMESSEQRVRQWTLAWWSVANDEARHLYSYFERTGKVPAPSQPPSQSLSAPQAATSVVRILGHGTVGAGLFGIHQYLAYWSYADGYQPIQVLWHSYNAVEETVGLYRLKGLNIGLVEGDEESWGFGQCLPIVLLFALLFSLSGPLRERHLKTQ